MGIQDREYLRDRPGHGGRPFTPPASSWTSWLLPFAGMLLIGLAVFSVVKRWMPPRPATPPAVVQQALPKPQDEAAPPTRRPPRDPFPNDPTWSTARRAPPAPPSGEQRTVYRCVIQGVTTWSDQPGCPQAATVMLDTPPPPAPTSPPPRPTTVYNTLPPPPPAVNVQAMATPRNDKTLACASIAESIRRVDAAARQPQVAAVQDELSSRKRELQKEGFFLHCNL